MSNLKGKELTICALAIRFTACSCFILALHLFPSLTLFAGEAFSAELTEKTNDCPDKDMPLGLPSLTVNGGFEEGNARGADHWNFSGSSRPRRTNAESHSGKFCVHVVLRNEGAKPCEGRVEHRVAERGAMIFGGLTYDFSFWSKTVRSGVGYVQQYRLEWLDRDGKVLGGTGFKQFRGKRDEWSKLTAKSLVAPDEAQDVRILFRLVTGSLKNSAGEVYIDDVELIPSVELAD